MRFSSWCIMNTRLVWCFEYCLANKYVYSGTGMLFSFTVLKSLLKSPGIDLCWESGTSSLTATSQPLHIDITVIYSQFFNIAPKHPQASCSVIYNALICLFTKYRSSGESEETRKEKANISGMLISVHCKNENKDFPSLVTSDKLSA